MPLRGDTILEWMAGRIAQIATASQLTFEGPSNFIESAYRLELSEEPDSGLNGKFYIELKEIQPHQREHGRQENIWTATVMAQFGYFFGGGDDAGRRGVQKNVLNDAMRIADFCEDPAGYDSDNTGIRRAKMLGFAPQQGNKHAEIWLGRFSVEWVSDWNNQ